MTKKTEKVGKLLNALQSAKTTLMSDYDKVQDVLKSKCNHWVWSSSLTKVVLREQRLDQ